nr:MAG TPA: hypothetical protein [Caudoviricetes sp.]
MPHARHQNYTSAPSALFHVDVVMFHQIGRPSVVS